MKQFQGKNFLIIGGAGFVGSNLAKALLSCSPKKITIIDNLLSAERLNVPQAPEVEFIEGSITDDSVLARIEDVCEYIFHLATFHGNQNSMHAPLADHENNTLTTLKLCERIKSFKNINKVVYASAGCTVAEKTYDTACATMEDAPVSLYLDSPYQISKIIGELYFNYYFMKHGLPAVKARFQNVYGPGEILGAGKWRGTYATVWRNVTPTFIYKSIKEEAIPVEGTGAASRDFIYVDDIVAGLLSCAADGKPGDVYNLASGMETAIGDLARLINELTGNQTPINFLPQRDWDRSGKRFGCTDKARSALGFTAATSLREGLQKTISWTKANLPLIESCMARHAAHMPS